MTLIFIKVVVISPDSCLVHKTWAHAPTEDGGLGGIHFPMMEVRMTTTMMNMLVVTMATMMSPLMMEAMMMTS